MRKLPFLQTRRAPRRHSHYYPVGGALKWPLSSRFHQKPMITTPVHNGRVLFVLACCSLYEVEKQHSLISLLRVSRLSLLLAEEDLPACRTVVTLLAFAGDRASVEEIMNEGLLLSGTHPRQRRAEEDGALRTIYTRRAMSSALDWVIELNTYRNAEKLLSAAEELAQTGECNPEEIYGVAKELENHVTSFAARVEQRRRRLDLAVLFYTHEKEVRLIKDGLWIMLIKDGNQYRPLNEVKRRRRLA
ncbi:unnamed protein product [Nezara viridula]|uniref:Uncharacterized protein n=1 Tax=Nezara viridula TaxID=85310 RepID=A0A9P0H2L4_NEZVI|nr:unnamed protein product [Nezara viridula]